MGNLAIHSMTDVAINKVRELEAAALNMQQAEIYTSHIIHGGLYSRTIMVPAGVMITGALVKIPTTLVIYGNALVSIGDESIELKGFNVLPAAAHRKQAFLASTDVFITMVFPTSAKTVSEAENQFTDEAAMLISRKDGNTNKVIVTGE